MKHGLVLGLLSALACAHAVTTPETPPLDQIAAIRITSGSLVGAKQREVRDPDRIRAVRGFLASHSRGWKTTPYTYPSPEDSIALVASSGTVLVVYWVGPNWLGGTTLERAPKATGLRSLTREEVDALLEMLGLSAQEPAAYKGLQLTSTHLGLSTTWGVWHHRRSINQQSGPGSRS